MARSGFHNRARSSLRRRAAKAGTLALLATAAGTSIAAAQDHAAGAPSAAAGPVRLDAVVVSATRSPESVDALPGSVTVVEREQIEQQAQVSKSLADVLGRLVPGLAASGGTNTNTAQTLRGRNILVLIDGVPQNTSRNVSRDLFTIDPAAVERIEVIRGATAIYGNGATGGVINVITRRPGDGAPRFTTRVDGEVSLSRPSSDSLGGRVEQGAAGKSGPLSYVLNVAAERAGGFFDAEGDRIPPEPSQGDLSDSRKYNVLSKLGLDLDGRTFELTANRLDARQDSDFVSDPAVNAFPPGAVKARALEGLSLDDQPETENTVLNLAYAEEDVWGSRLDGQIYYRDYLTTFFPFDGRRLAAWRNVAQTRLESETAGGRLAATTPFSLDGLGDASLVWGADYAREDTAQPVAIFDPAAFDASGGRVFLKTGDRTFAPSVVQDSIGLFAQGELQVGPRWTLRAGLRHERIEAEVDDFVTLGAGNPIRGGSVDYQDTVYNAGLVFAATEQVELFANYSQGFSLPDLGLILRGAPAGFQISASTLEPLEVDSYEVGARGDWGPLQSSLSLFYNESDLGVTSGGFAATVVRAPERVYGLEATLDASLSTDWRAGGTFTWLEGESDPDRDGDYTALNGFRIPPPKLTAYVEYDPLPGWRTRLQALYSADRDRAADDGVGFGGRSVDDYLVLDLISAFDVGPGTLNVGVQNLLNTQYHTAFTQLLPNGANVSHLAARGAVLTVGYSLTW